MEDIKVTLEKLRGMYTQDISQDTFNALIIGPKAIGKTQLALTCRKPVLIHSFDPGGTKHLRKEIKEGGIIVNPSFENEDARNPTAYAAWEEEFDSLRKDGVFSHIGTYILDSLTTWQGALYSQIARKTKFASDGVLEIKGWAILINTLRDMAKLCTSLPCDFILTGHVSRDKDDVSGKILIGLAAPPSTQVSIPILFDEYYVMQVSPQDNKNRVLLTSNTDKCAAGTRMGRGKFEAYEKPDIKYLLKKAGYNTDDKLY